MQGSTGQSQNWNFTSSTPRAYPRAELGSLAETHPCCSKRLPNLFIKSSKASATVIITFGPLSSVKGIRERWFLVFLPSSQRWHWKPEMTFLYSGAVMHKDPRSPEGLEHAVSVLAVWVICGAGGLVQEAEELSMPSPCLALQGSPERCATAA